MSRVGVVCYRQEVEKKSCIPFLVELGRVRSGNFGDRDDQVDRIGSGNPPLRINDWVFTTTPLNTIMFTNKWLVLI
ncbi:hypothetical protein DPMN_119861 [Dreissena polymorpha]|uniref:Uncharacterized protein n=1 Tax=Dreissena polymorpha TaxID=45954 RepID=A0A9D4GJB9_DREPO|nr:hypothetical protein DPMN_119861 [Dreissena polymorpha]